MAAFLDRAEVGKPPSPCQEKVHRCRKGKPTRDVGISGLSIEKITKWCVIKVGAKERFL